MGKPKGPTFAQVGADFRAGPLSPHVIEAREFRVLSETSAMGRSSFTSKCPFCRREITIYVWSLSGGGKRCDCGALFGSGGHAYHWADSSRR